MEKAGHSVLEASDGMEGISVALSEHPNLIFLDVMIPKKDGWQVCREIKKTVDIPIIMITTCTQKIEEMRGWESGADDYIGKPWVPADLAQAVERALKKPAA